MWDINRPDIETTITFLRTEEGGRRRPVSSGYRPQFFYDGDDCDAVHFYQGVEQVNPGDAVTADLAFIRPEFRVGTIHVGMEFLIREGAQTVAVGKVTKILNLEANAIRERAAEQERGLEG
jgi:translation elongation factor EF-Tu-like GTPase